MNLRNDKGFSLIELISALVLVAILFIMASWGVYAFIVKYQQLVRYADLQEEAVAAIETIKHGGPMGDSFNTIFLGVASADSLQLLNYSYEHGGYRTIKCYSSKNETAHLNDYVEFYWDPITGKIKYNSLYGTSFTNAEQIFPQDANDERIKANKLIFNFYHSNKIVTVDFEAEVRINEAEEEEDIEKRKVNFKTKISSVKN